MINKDHPSFLLQRYNFVVVKTKPQYLNTLCKPCCFTAANSYNVYKWEPNDPQYDKTNGHSSKRIMKIKEHSNCCLRCLCPASLRGYESYFVAEYNRKVAFMFSKPI